jgi:hypothetical protein
MFRCSFCCVEPVYCDTFQLLEAHVVALHQDVSFSNGDFVEYRHVDGTWRIGVVVRENVGTYDIQDEVSNCLLGISCIVFE